MAFAQAANPCSLGIGPECKSVAKGVGIVVGVDVEVEVGRTIDVWAVVEGSGVAGFGHTRCRTSSGQHSEMMPFERKAEGKDYSL